MTEVEQMVRAVIAYDGTELHGWAKQPGLPTVQGWLMEALSTIHNRPAETIQFQGASRTDAGVHASGQVASFLRDARLNEWDYERGMNALTPQSILIRKIEFLDFPFNARFDSQGKRYEYRIWNQRYPEPLERYRTWTFGSELDLDAMREAAAFLVGEKDFAAFRAADCQSNSTIRKIFSISITQEGKLIRIVVQGNAFMKNMVRIIAGSLAEVGEGRIPAARIKEALESRDRRLAGRTAPPEGLCLMEVFYDR